MGNYSSCFDGEAEAIMSKMVDAERDCGWVEVVGEIGKDPPPFFVNAKGGVPKKDEAGHVRVGVLRPITDHSRPKGRNVNSFRRPPKFKFDSIDDALRLVKRDHFMAKVDLKGAYRHVPIFPGHHKFFGFVWGKHYYKDKFMGFGWSWAPWIFTILGRAVVWIAGRRGIRLLLVYIDDFLIIAESEGSAQKAYDIFLELLGELGLDHEPKKCVPPTKCIIFLGIEIDSAAMEARVPTARLQKLHALVKTWSNRESATVGEVQSLVGLLGFAAKVVHGARTFLRRLINLVCYRRHRHKTVTLSKGSKEDLQWFLDFLPTWNGKALLLEKPTIPPLCLQTDASSTIGAGAFYAGEMLQYRWEELGINYGTVTLHIGTLETIPAVLAARKWGHRWKGREVVVWIDNTQAVSSINRGSHPSELVLGWLRELFHLSARHGFRITAKYLKGKWNKLADDLSRFEMEAYEVHRAQWSAWMADTEWLFEAHDWMTRPEATAPFFGVGRERAAEAAKAEAGKQEVIVEDLPSLFDLE
eukprot:TRINITY_DN2697_c0_g1_i3.p1 TRINITY_DN2697_c0_g1~~TRINITY_DN2697_c0_g1_i3.p1  ORF type:complete len:528 (+),score=127.40 TRINITY_DN2697_c0_g1_i3:3333-4916(+)